MIVGYSVNDTIVVFDRIREDLQMNRGKSYKDVANLAINRTLSRTVLTSLMTLLTVIMLLTLGGAVKTLLLRCLLAFLSEPIHLFLSQLRSCCYGIKKRKFLK